MIKLYRDIAVRVLGDELCNKVDFLRQNGINIHDLIVSTINTKYSELKKGDAKNKNCNNRNYCNPECYTSYHLG
jgi:hypothetical protein